MIDDQYVTTLYSWLIKFKSLGKSLQSLDSIAALNDIVKWEVGYFVDCWYAHGFPNETVDH